MPTPEIKLVRTPGTCGGSLRIDGTRMTVGQIVILHNQGMSIEEIVEQYPWRTPAEISAAVNWYHANKEAFDAELAAEDAEYDRLKAEHEQAARR